MKKVLVRIPGCVLVFAWILMVDPVYADSGPLPRISGTFKGFSNWQSVERILGRPGIEQGDMLKISFPRTDLNVTVQGIPLEPGLALTSWFVFKPFDAASAFAKAPVDKSSDRQGKFLQETLLWGELALLEEEVPKALKQLIQNGFQITTLGHRLLNESPDINYFHISGKGPRVKLAQALKDLLSTLPIPPDTGGKEGDFGPTPKNLSAQPVRTQSSFPPPDPSTGSTGSPQASSPLRPVGFWLRPLPTPSLAETGGYARQAEGQAGQDWSKVQELLGPGKVNGRVLQYGFPRAGAVTEKGIEIPPFMGGETTLRFQKVKGLVIGQKGIFGLGADSKPSKDIVAAAGDFILTADEVNPVVKSLGLNQITVTAIDQPRREESPPLFILHFWALGMTEEVAAGLKATLDLVHLARPK